MEPALAAIESGEFSSYDDAGSISKIDTVSYELSATPVSIKGAGVYTYDPNSVAPPDNVNVIRPSVGPAATGPGRWLLRSGGGGAGAIDIYDEGVVVKLGVTELDFIGVDVKAQDPGGLFPNRVQVFIPPPVYLSHWNKADGSNGAQSVSESISRTLAHVATPNGGEGFPFRTSGWAATNRDATLTGTVVFTTPANTTGFGGDSTMTVEVFDANGVTVLETFTTPSLTGNGPYPSPGGRIVVTIAGYAADSTRWQAKATVSVNVAAVLTLAGLSGGRYHVRTTFTPDTTTDGTGACVYTQTDVFLDANPSTPSISGAVVIVETGAGIVTKHLSGIEYYTTGSQFTVGVTGIDNLNANTSRTAGNLELNGTEYGLTALSQCPFGAGAANFIAWTNNDNNVGASYNKTDWTISAVNYRYMAPTCNITSYDRDPWASGGTIPSANALVMIDTYSTSSTALAEYFDDESRREDPASFPGIGTWVGTAPLAPGAAIVYNGQLAVPNTTTYVRSDGPATPNADWSAYKPDLGGANPDYTALGAPVDYGRRFTQAPGWIPSFSMVFSGTFAAGSMLADLVAGNVEIYVYRVGGLGHVGPPPANIWPLRVHRPYNFAVWDDGVTVPGSGIREGSSVGNTINCTFGAGTSANGGFYCHLRIINPATKIDSMVVTFF